MAGGRYDGLVEKMGGPPTPGVGWAAGIERLAHAAGRSAAGAAAADLRHPGRRRAAKRMALVLSHGAAPAGHAVELGYRGNLKRRMKRANKLQCAAPPCILGDDELAKGEAARCAICDGRAARGRARSTSRTHLAASSERAVSRLAARAPGKDFRFARTLHDRLTASVAPSSQLDAARRNAAGTLDAAALHARLQASMPSSTPLVEAIADAARGRAARSWPTLRCWPIAATDAEMRDHGRARGADAAAAAAAGAGARACD